MNSRTNRLAPAAAILAVMICNPAGAEPPVEVPTIDGGRILRPAAESDLDLTAGKAFDLTTKNFVVRWLTPSYGINGTLDDDLIGEAEVAPSCAGTPIGGGSGAPYAYTSASTRSDGTVSVGYYDAPGDNMDVVQYFLTQVESEQAKDVMMLVGADDGIRVWLNGDEVLRQDAPADYLEGALQAPVTLREGWNLLLVKVYYPQLGPSGDPDHSYKFWSLRFTEGDGVTPVRDVYQSVDGWCTPSDGYYGWVWAPGAADAEGAFGSQWQSELRITNPYYHNLFVTLQYFANSNTNGIPDAERILRLDSFETVSFENVVRELTGESNTGSGMIALHGLYYSDVSAYDAARLVTSNVGGDDGGSFGTQMPFGYRYNGQTCCSQQLYGLRNGPDNRTNLLVLPQPFVADEMTFTVELWDPESGQTSSGEFTGRGSFQINDIFAKLGMGGVDTTTAIAQVTYSNYGTYLRIMASVNDNVTSDPTLVERAPFGIPTPFQ